MFLVVLLRHACRQEVDTADGSANNLRIQQAIGKNLGRAMMGGGIHKLPCTCMVWYGHYLHVPAIVNL